MSLLRRIRVAIVLALVGLPAMLSCSSNSGSVPPTADPAAFPQPLANGADLYRPPDPLPTANAGTLLSYEEIGAPVPASRAWRVLYLSRSFDDEPIAVSGLVVAPATEPPDGGFPVVSWAHPTAGAADTCAPSKRGPNSIIGLGGLIAAGFVVTATDYEGLGTPGIHPYLVGLSEAHAVIDAARTADDLPGVSTSDATLFWGYSQGGHAALFAAQEASDHAPELQVVGTVAAAPAADLQRLVGGDDGRPPLWAVALLIVGTWGENYGIDVDSVLTPSATALVPRLEDTCDVNEILTSMTSRHLIVRPLSEVDPWGHYIVQNTPGHARPSGPVLLIQGDNDVLIAPQSTAELFRRLCRRGAVTELRRFGTAGHEVAIRAAEQVTAWLAHREQGQPALDECRA